MGRVKKIIISWYIVCRPKEFGVLGIEKTSLRNRAHLGKLLYRFPKENCGLWHQVISSIYRTHPNGWDSNILVRWSQDVLRRLLHKSGRNFPHILALWWVTGREFNSKKICGGVITICVHNFQVSIELSHWKISPQGPNQSGFFCLGSRVGEDSHPG